MSDVRVFVSYHDWVSFCEQIDRGFSFFSSSSSFTSSSSSSSSFTALHDRLKILEDLLRSSNTTEQFQQLEQVLETMTTKMQSQDNIISSQFSSLRNVSCVPGFPNLWDGYFKFLAWATNKVMCKVCFGLDHVVGLVFTCLVLLAYLYVRASRSNDYGQQHHQFVETPGTTYIPPHSCAEKRVGK